MPQWTVGSLKRKAGPADAPPPPKRRDLLGDYNTGLAEIDLAARLAEYDQQTNRPIQPNTQKNLDRAVHAFCVFTVTLNNPGLTSIDPAQIAAAQSKWFSEDADVPAQSVVLLWLEQTAQRGLSRIKRGTKGWARNTTYNLFCSFVSARDRAGAKPIPKKFKQNVINRIDTWAAEGSLVTDTLAKPIVRHQDYVELQAAFWALGSSPFLKVQIVALSGILYFTGQRPGAILEAPSYTGTNQCLTYGDTELFYVGQDEHGPRFQFIMYIRWAKNLRHRASQKIIIQLRNTADGNLHIDPVIPFLALGHFVGVWMESILDYFEGKNLPSCVPHLIAVHPKFKDEPIFRTANRERAWSPSGAGHVFSKGCEAAGFQAINMYLLRHSWATNMANNNVPLHVLQAYMGHNPNSSLSQTTYQSGYVQHDIQATLLNETPAADDPTTLRASVAYEHYVSGNLSGIDCHRLLEILSPIAPLAIELAQEAEMGEDEEMVAHITSQLMYAVNNIGTLPKRDKAFSEADAHLVLKHFQGPFRELADRVRNYSTLEQENTDAMTLAFEHPLCGVIRDSDRLARHALFHYMYQVLVGESLRLAHHCTFCDARGVKTPDSAVNDWGYHVVTCEQYWMETFGLVRCDVCFNFIPKDDEDHQLECNDKAVAIVQSVEVQPITERVTSEQVMKGKTKAKSAPIAQALKPFCFEHTTNGAHEPLTRTFCPSCLKNPAKPVSKRNKARYGITLTMQHLVTDFGPKGQDFGTTPIQCGLCGGQPMKVHLYIEHLHHHHHIPLIECTRDHDHSSDCCLSLPENPRFYDDAKYEASIPGLGYVMPDAVVIDHRPIGIRRKARAKVDKRAKQLGIMIEEEVEVGEALEALEAAAEADTSASTLVEDSLPETYTWETFAAEFNVPAPVMAKIQPLDEADCFPISFPLDMIADVVWDTGKFTNAEIITLKRKHAHLLDMVARGRFHSPDYTPARSEFLTTPAPLVLKKDTRAKLDSIGFSWDDPVGMQSLPAAVWESVNVIPMARSSILQQFQLAAAKVPRITL